MSHTVEVTRLRQLSAGKTPAGDRIPGPDSELALDAVVLRAEPGWAFIEVPYSDEGGTPVLSIAGGHFGRDRVRLDGETFEVVHTESRIPSRTDAGAVRARLERLE